METPPGYKKRYLGHSLLFFSQSPEIFLGSLALGLGPGFIALLLSLGNLSLVLHLLEKIGLLFPALLVGLAALLAGAHIEIFALRRSLGLAWSLWRGVLALAGSGRQSCTTSDTGKRSAESLSEGGWLVRWFGCRCRCRCSGGRPGSAAYIP